jgi:mRNA-degrading endonuclease RelE of RelBE toxin-antitoxin system
MYKLIFRDRFNSQFNKIKDKNFRKQIYLKILQLKIRCPLGKKLTNTNFWRIRIKNYRVVYEIFEFEKEVEIITILKRNKEYKDL